MRTVLRSVATLTSILSRTSSTSTCLTPKRRKSSRKSSGRERRRSNSRWPCSATLPVALGKAYRRARQVHKLLIIKFKRPRQVKREVVPSIIPKRKVPQRTRIRRMSARLSKSHRGQTTAADSTLTSRTIIFSNIIRRTSRRNQTKRKERTAPSCLKKRSTTCPPMSCSAIFKTRERA